VAKYAQASNVRVRLWIDDSHLAFSVTDDGKGFDAATAAKSSGLQNMRDRMDALGGTLEVRSAPGTGTTVSGQVPTSSTPSPLGVRVGVGGN